RDFHDGEPEAPEDFEVHPRVAADVGHAADQKDRDVDAALGERPRDDEAVAAVVAAAAQHGDLPIGQIGVHRLHGRHRLAAGVLHQHQRRNADVVDRATVRLAHLGAVQNPHLRQGHTCDRGHRGYNSASGICYRLCSMAATVNVNGRVSDQEHAVISVFDHGFLYGEGVYETLRTYSGQP